MASEMLSFHTTNGPAGAYVANPENGNGKAVLVRVVTEDSGQDIIEYALLAAFIGCIGAAAWQAVHQAAGVITDGESQRQRPNDAAQNIAEFDADHRIEHKKIIP